MSRLAALLLVVAAAPTAGALARPHVGRRAVLASVGVAVSSMPRPAHADAIKDAALYQDEEHNIESLGSAAAYVPSVELKAKGASSSLVAVTMPPSGARSVGDYVRDPPLNPSNYTRPLLKASILATFRSTQCGSWTPRHSRSSLQRTMVQTGSPRKNRSKRASAGLDPLTSGLPSHQSAHCLAGVVETRLRSDTGVDPSFAFRIKSGLEIVPFVHCNKGGTWEGSPFTVR